MERIKRVGNSVGKSTWPGGDCFVPADTGLLSGEKFTITGIQRRKDGTIVRNCKPGEETTFVAQIDV